jgi:hypothetical protein
MQYQVQYSAGSTRFAVMQKSYSHPNFSIQANDGFFNRKANYKDRQRQFKLRSRLRSFPWIDAADTDVDVCLSSP